jgi:hypothetical protein
LAEDLLRVSKYPLRANNSYRQKGQGEEKTITQEQKKKKDTPCIACPTGKQDREPKKYKKAT